jgi:hypothetical protein
MSRIGIVLYRPRKGKDEELVNMIRDHFPFLRKEGLITERKTLAMKTKDGSVMVVFEWASSESIEKAAAHEGVQHIWMQVSKISDFDKPGSVQELDEVFPDFETIDIE